MREFQWLLVSIKLLHLARSGSRAAEVPHAAKIKSAELTKDLEDCGRGFSINQVQNGCAESLSIFNLSARSGLAATRGCAADSLTSRVWTNITRMSFIPGTSCGFIRSRELKCVSKTLKDY